MNQKSQKKHIIIGITGASGAIYGIELLKILKEIGVHTHLIMSKSSHITIKLETGMQPNEVARLASKTHQSNDIAACISSGSFRTDGMIIAPCSMRSMGEIASCTTSSLLTRAADVVLKERRKLVMMVRETPLHSIHLEQMHRLSQAGAIIFPPAPAFYNKPETIDDIVQHSVCRVLDLFDIDAGKITRWKE